MKNAVQLIAYRNKKAESMNTLIGLVAMCIGIFIILRGGGIGTGILVLIAGGVVAIFSFVTFLDRKPVVIISDSGLWARHAASEVIPWEAISETRIKAIPRGGTFIEIYLNGKHGFDFEVSGLNQPATLIYRSICDRIPSNDGME